MVKYDDLAMTAAERKRAAANFDDAGFRASSPIRFPFSRCRCADPTEKFKAWRAAHPEAGK